MRNLFPVCLLSIFIHHGFSEAPVSIRFMTEDFTAEWPSHLLHGNDHYSFNIRIVDDMAVDSLARFTIASRSGKDTETVFAAKVSDSSYHAEVFIEGSTRNGVLKVGWRDTIICSYKTYSDTVFNDHVLALQPSRVGLARSQKPYRFAINGTRQPPIVTGKRRLFSR